jgi:signal transduction histidine kinase
MVAVVSHEIKNPLMIMRASAERLEKSGLKEAHFIIEETDRLNNIVTGYLDFASGKRTLSLERVDLKKMLSSITEQFIPRLAREGVVLSSVGPTSAVPATADPVALRQVIINLILNGAEASKRMRNACVNVSCAMGSSQPMIEVKDNGKGMSAGEQKSIFEPFYTTKTTGSGLGLFLSRSLVRQMGGEITLESKKGGPTLFRVTLPPADKV